MEKAQTLQGTWSLLLNESKKSINEKLVQRWLTPLKAVTFGHGCLVIGSSSTFLVEYVQKNLMQSLNDVGKTLFGNDFGIEVQVIDEDRGPIQKVSRQTKPRFLIQEEQARDNLLLERLTFNNFVVGKYNEFAHAASLAVAEAPAKTYNPFFIYGGVGLGKTHLMQAIGNQVQRTFRLKKIHYITTERFMNEMVQAIQQGKMTGFRNQYRKVDLLLVDDVQFLARKESTQEEFFHTFNALYEAQKQIVLTCDRPPKEIPTLEERLVSRFSWGLVADIQPPDLETRLAILKKMADDKDLLMPDDVLMFIANNVKSNVRQLEGSVIRLLAHSSLHRMDITLELAKDVLKDIILDEIRKVSVERILSHVANKYNIPAQSLKSRNRTQQVSFPRQIAMYLCRLLTDLSLMEIGEAIGGRDHTTIMHACEKVNKQMLASKSFKQEIGNLIENIKEYEVPKAS